MIPSIQVYRLTEETVALAATVAVSWCGAFGVVVDGEIVPRRVVTGSAIAVSGRRLLWAMLPCPIPGALLAFEGTHGERLAEAPMRSLDEMPPFEIDAVAGAIGGAGERIDFLRRVSAGGPILGLGRSRTFQDVRLSAVARAVELSSPCAVERSIRLDGGVILWTLDVESPSAVESVELQQGSAVLTSPFKPALLVGQVTTPAADRARVLLLTDAGGAGITTDRLLLWGRASLRVAELRGVGTQVASGLLPLVQSLGDRAGQLVGYLAATLGPYLPARPDLRALLSEAAAMCPPRPARALVSDRPIGLGVDLAIVTTEGRLFARGWMVDPLGLIGRVSWIHPNGARIPISDRWVITRASGAPERYCQPGQDAPSAFGFAVAIDGAGAASWLRQQVFEVELRSGAAMEVVAPASPSTPVAARDAVLSVVHDDDFTNRLAAEAIAPMVADLQRAHLAGDRIASQIVIGNLPNRPAVSVVVPLYRVLEFLRYQTAAFAYDPGFAGAEWVLVLDSPEQAPEVEMRMRALHALYGVAVRIVVHRRNLGYAPAINTGVGVSRGTSLVLMNSDVVPVANGWIPALRARLDAGAGAVGPKLLFHDDSIQHAGMSFGRDLRGDYFNRHEFKGYPRDYPPACAARPVPALTGACLALSRDVLAAVGGVCEDYVVGDFEDSDLSFRILATGRSLWYEPAAELYHYERQSIAQNDSYTTTRACGYNRWLHAQRWRRELDRLTSGSDRDNAGSVSVGEGGRSGRKPG